MAEEPEKRTIVHAYKPEELEKINIKINDTKKFIEQNASNIDDKILAELKKMLRTLENIYHNAQIMNKRIADIKKIISQATDNTDRKTISYLKELLYKLEVDRNYDTNLFELMYNTYGNNNQMFFKQIIMPCPITPQDRAIFAVEFEDILLPYLIDSKNIYDSFSHEGPYETGDYVCLEQGDIVIDCGANMGMFSALASAKGCRVYAFEPMKYTINNYLSKTAAWNENITICPYALSNEKKTLVFKLNRKNIGGSRAVKGNDETGADYQQVQAITLDEFVLQNNISKVDFIKADIEGAERHMLSGARDIIKEFSPKISICTYHLPDDSKVFREILLDIQPKYKIEVNYLKMYAYV